MSNHIQFLEEGSLTALSSWSLDPLEVCLSCHACWLGQGDDNPRGVEYVVIGTCYTLSSEEEMEPSKGRILVFEVTISPDDRRVVSLVTEREVKGAVYALDHMHNRVIAGVGYRVNRHSRLSFVF